MNLKLYGHRITASLAALSLLGACSAAPANLVVFAASSTRVINGDFPGVTFNNAGSSTLVQQLHDGAPADILITASQQTMDQAVRDGSVKDPVELATNNLVMVVPHGNPAGIKTAQDLNDHHVIALCDPTVPCGAVAEKIKQDQHLNFHADTLELQVADVLGKVASGAADVGWVYSTDAASLAGPNPAVDVIPLPGAEKFPNKILGAVTQHTHHPAQAQAWLDALSHSKTWQEHGFITH